MKFSLLIGCFAQNGNCNVAHFMQLKIHVDQEIGVYKRHLMLLIFSVHSFVHELSKSNLRIVSKMIDWL